MQDAHAHGGDVRGKMPTPTERMCGAGCPRLRRECAGQDAHAHGGNVRAGQDAHAYGGNARGNARGRMPTPTEETKYVWHQRHHYLREMELV